MIIYRIISAFITILIVVPLWIIICIILVIYGFLNGAIYRNFINQEELVKTNSTFINKFSSLVGMVLAGFIQNIKQLKTIKL